MFQVPSGIVGLPGGEGLDRLLHLVVEGHIGDQVAYPEGMHASVQRSRVHRGPGPRQPRHAHEAWLAVDLR